MSKGFTLLEVMLSVFITGIVFAAVLSAYMFLGRGLIREGNMQKLEVAARRSLYYFSQDVATATSVDSGTTYGYSTSVLGLFTPSGTEVVYTYKSGLNGTGTLTRAVVNGQSITLMTGLQSFSFGYFDTLGGPIIDPGPTFLNSNSTNRNNPNAIKLINMTFQIVSGVSSSGTLAFFNVVSPRVSMDNKGFLQ